PLLVPGFQSLTSVKSRAVGDASLHVGVPTNEEYVNLYGWIVTSYPTAFIFCATYCTDCQYPGSPELRDGWPSRPGFASAIAWKAFMWFQRSFVWMQGSSLSGERLLR